jgi:hypothetical protein
MTDSFLTLSSTAAPQQGGRFSHTQSTELAADVQRIKSIGVFELIATRAITKVLEALRSV